MFTKKHPMTEDQNKILLALNKIKSHKITIVIKNGIFDSKPAFEIEVSKVTPYIFFGKKQKASYRMQMLITHTSEYLIVKQQLFDNLRIDLK